VDGSPRFDGGLLRLLLDDGVTPVVSRPPSRGRSSGSCQTPTGSAAAVAVELKARTLVLLTSRPAAPSESELTPQLLARGRACGDGTPESRAAIVRLSPRS